VSHSSPPDNGGLFIFRQSFSPDQKGMTVRAKALSSRDWARGVWILRLLQPSGRGQHLVGFGADADVFSEVCPAHSAGGIHQELRRTRNVRVVRPAAFVQQVVAADGFSLRIGQDSKGIAGLIGQVARDFRCVNADGYRTNTGGFKLFQVFLDAS
jgi:hypothetical protein